MKIDLNENYISVFVRKFVICYCIFYKYSLHYVILLHLQNEAHNTHCVQQNNQFLLHNTAVFQIVGYENSNTKNQK